MSIKVTGNTKPFKDFAKELDKNIEEALTKGGDILTKDSKRKVPVDTGRLKRSIGYWVKRIANGWRLRFGVGVQTGDDVHYAPHQEYGTRYIKPVRYLRAPLHDRDKRIKNLINSATRKSFKI